MEMTGESMRMVSAGPERGEDGRPTGRVEIRALRDHEGGATCTVIIECLEVDGVAHLIADLAAAIAMVSRKTGRR
jgi:hypothetical protein